MDWYVASRFWTEQERPNLCPGVFSSIDMETVRSGSTAQAKALRYGKALHESRRIDCRNGTCGASSFPFALITVSIFCCLSSQNQVVHASERQISRRDPLRPFMDIVCMDFMKRKPSGIELEKGQHLDDHIKQLTSEELDYALDMRGLTDLRRRVRDSTNRFEGIRTEYTAAVKHALFLSEVCKRRRNRDYASAGDSRAEPLYWYGLCVISPILGRMAAIIFALLSAVVVWSELVIAGQRGYLSPIHLLMTSAKTEWAVYCVTVIPLVSIASQRSHLTRACVLGLHVFLHLSHTV